jgi:hypothetical protein
VVGLAHSELRVVNVGKLSQQDFTLTLSERGLVELWRVLEREVAVLLPTLELGKVEERRAGVEVEEPLYQ